MQIYKNKWAFFVNNDIENRQSKIDNRPIKKVRPSATLFLLTTKQVLT